MQSLLCKLNGLWAGALKKKGFILWKDTLFTKNATPNERLFRSKRGHWKEDFDKWIKTVQEINWNHD